MESAAIRTDVISEAGADAPTVVLLNSLAADLTMWDSVSDLLREDHRVVRFDQRDRPGTRAHKPFALDDLVDDLIAVMDATDTKTAHIVGVSLGGIVALRAAARHPDRVSSLVAMCCAARFPREVWVERAASVRAHGVEPLIPAILDRWFTRELQAGEPGLVDAHRRMLETTDRLGYAHASDALAEADARPDLARIDVPALVVTGSEDSANPVEHQLTIVEGIRGARHVILDGVAHLAPPSAPAEVARLVREHVRGSARGIDS